jgi:predicted Zn finger-like uncharacterized protein
MPDQIKCPSCSAPLRVPESMLGQTVRCPQCQSTFTAGVAEEPGREGIAAEPAPGPRPPPRRDQADDDDRGGVTDRPRRRPRGDEPDEDFPDYEGRRGRSGRSIEAAQAMVMAPAICMMVLGGLEIALQIVGILLRMLGIGLMAAGGGPGQGPPAGDAEMIAQMAGGVIGSIIGIALGALILTGGVMMKQLRNYGLAMTGAIVAMLPCSLCCLLGLPLGIWSLVVLNNQDVKDAFR